MNYSFDYYKQIEDTTVYLCNPNLNPICALNGRERHVILRFNDLSEFSFIVDKTEDLPEQYYKKIQTKRVLYLEKIGWFQITAVQETDEGSACYKTVTAKSHQIVFQDRGFISEDRAYMFYNPNDPMDAQYDSTNISAIPSVIGQLAQQCGLKIDLSLTGAVDLTKDYKKWTIIYIAPELIFQAKSYGQMYESGDSNNLVRHFSENKQLFAYDFIINEVEEAFNVIFDFDFLHHSISIKMFNEVVSPTDIYLSFDNLVNTITLEENSDNITTVLNCEGEDLDITTVNPMGTNYIVDFEYYMQETDEDGHPYPWMSKELIEAIREWKTIYDSEVDNYSTIVLNLQEKYVAQAEIKEQLQFANLKTTDLKTAIDQYTGAENQETAGTYPTNVEEVNEGKTSLIPSSGYYNTVFTAKSTITGYKTIPVLNTDNYTYSMSGDNKTGTANSMISAYIVPANEEEVPEDCFLYFQDGDTRSYCKLVIASEIAVAKDKIGEDGVAISLSDNNSIGYVELEEATFKVTLTNGTIRVFNNANGQEVSYVANHHDYFDFDGSRYQYFKTADDFVTITKFYVSGFTRHTVYANLVGDDGWQALWEKRAATLEAQKDDLQDDIDVILKDVAEINSKCDIQKYIKAKGNDLYDELFHYWIEGTYTNSNLAADDDTSLADRIDLAKELMKSAEEELKYSAQPTFTFKADVVNFLRLIEFTQLTSQLELGKTITIEKDDTTCYFPALMSMEYNLDDGENFSLTFSSSARPNDTSLTIADLLKESSDISRTVTSNWANLMDFSENKETLTSMIEDPLNRALRTMQEGLSNQQFIVDQTGILGRRYTDDSQSAFQPEQVRLINNLLVFTDDNWKTTKTALGKIEGYGYGLVAEVIIGKFLLGDNLQIGSASNNVSITDEGIVVNNGSIKIYSDESKNPILYVDSNGNLQLNGYATTTSVDDKLDNYYTSSTVDNKLESTVNSISSSITETLLNYTTNSELENTLKNYSTTAQINKVLENYYTSGSVDTMLKGITDIIGDMSAAGIEGTIAINLSNIKQTQEGIESTVGTIQADISDIDDKIGDANTPGTILYNYSQLSQKADKISGTVTSIQEEYATKEGSSQSFSYQLTSEAFKLISNNNTVLNVTGNNAVIFGFTVGVDSIYNGRVSLEDNEHEGIYVGTDGISLGVDSSGTPRIIMTKSGELYASNATISGYINAIGDINASILYGSEVNVSKIRGANIVIGSTEENDNAANKIQCDFGTIIDFGYLKDISSETVTAILEKTDSDKITLRCDKTLTVTKSFTVYYSTFEGLWTKDRTCVITINKGSNSYTYKCENILANSSSADKEFGFDKNYEVTKKTFSQPAATTLNFGMTGNILPTSNVYNIGAKEYYWNTGYFKNLYGLSMGEISGSDKNIKNSILPISDKYSELFDRLVPVTFKYNDGESGRVHTGLIANDIKQALKELGIPSTEFAAYCEWDREGELTSGIRYSELIALCIYEIQKLKKKLYKS